MSHHPDSPKPELSILGSFLTNLLLFVSDHLLIYNCVSRDQVNMVECSIRGFCNAS